MIYYLTAGVLCAADEAQPLASIRGCLCGAEKQVFDRDNSLLLRTDIRLLGADAQAVPAKEYVMYGPDGSELAVAKPRCSTGDDPAAASWPVCRMPRADEAVLTMEGQEYTLVMENVQNYVLTDAKGRCAVRIIHRGMTGGWKLDVSQPLSPSLLCGLFIFCRYLEKENEFVVV